jgi:hypothetical protein
MKAFLAALVLLAITPISAIAETVACAKDYVNVREAYTTQNPEYTITAFPISQRPVVRVLEPGTCSLDRGLPTQWDGGYKWINISTPDGQVGWAASEFFEFHNVGHDNF